MTPSNKPTTVAVVANTTWNLHNFRSGLIRALVSSGYRVIAVAPPDNAVEAVRSLGVEFVALKHMSRQGKNPIREVFQIRELRRIYREYDVDFALHYTIKPVIFGTFAARGTKVRTINTLTGLGYAFLSNGFVNKVVTYLYRQSLRHADRVFFQNNDDLALFSRLRLISDGHGQVIAGSGINLEHFRVRPYPEDNGHFNVLFIGRLLRDKGIFELIDAARKHHAIDPRLRLHLVGGFDAGNPSSISPEDLEEWASLDWLLYHGTVPDTRPYIEEAHVVVLPSYREGLPRVMLESMALARPVIATDVPGCRETVIPGENGYLVPVKNAEALQLAMVDMVSLERDRRIEMGQRGRELAERVFAEPIIINRYLETIRSMLQGSAVKSYPRAI